VTASSASHLSTGTIALVLLTVASSDSPDSVAMTLTRATR
jgi:hypothetical protein